jgi:7-carboxy-7-deazaguanine synthase
MDDPNVAIGGGHGELPLGVRGSKKLPVMEIFGPTIQGEGSMIGVQTIFVRFGVCDYRCTKCDSLHAVLPDQIKAHAEWLTQEDLFLLLMQRVKESGCSWITFSGGNPCSHDLMQLVYMLHGQGVRVQVETQGSIWRDWVQYCDAVVISPKSPGMGEKFERDKFENFLNRLGLHPNAVVKIVVFSLFDIEFACDVFDIATPFWLIPNRKYISLGNHMPPEVDGGSLQPRFDIQALLANYCVLYEEVLNNKRTRDVITLPQLHVILWGNARGV